MSYGIDYRDMDGNHGNRRENIVVPCFVRFGNRSVMAVLLPCASRRPASVVVPIDKLSILVTIAFSWIVFHEKLTKKSALGIVCITVGTVLLAIN